MSEEKILEEIRDEIRGLREELRELRKDINKDIKPLQYYYGGMWGALLWTVTVIGLFGIGFMELSKAMPWIQAYAIGLANGLIGAVIVAVLWVKTVTKKRTED